MSFLKVTEMEDFIYEEAPIRALINQELDKRVNKLFVDSVLVKANLNDAEKNAILALQAP